MGVLLSSRRHLAIAGFVVLFHVAALWVLQAGLIRRVMGVFVPVVVLSELIEPPRSHVEPPPPAPKPMAPTAPRKIESLPPPPMPLAMADPAPAINAPASVMAPPMAAPVAAAPPRIELPSSDADYLQNPKPVYPAMSKRFGEQGQVVLRVLIGADGVAQKAEIRRSSGYDRLDHAALATVQRWRYVPGRRGGVPEAMWFNVPIHFVLE